MHGIALAQSSEERQNVTFGDFVRGMNPDYGQELLVPPQIAPVGGQRIAGQPTLDRQVVEVLRQGCDHGSRRTRCAVVDPRRRAHAGTIATTPDDE